MGSTGSKGQRTPTSSTHDPGLITAVQHVKADLIARTIRADPDGKKKHKAEAEQQINKQELECDATQPSNEEQLQVNKKLLKTQRIERIVEDRDAKPKERTIVQGVSAKRKGARTPDAELRMATKKESDVSREKFSAFLFKKKMTTKEKSAESKEERRKVCSILSRGIKKDKGRPVGKASATKVAAAKAMVASPIPGDDDYTDFEPTDAVSRPARAE